jgi:hypothetical protein
MNLLLCMNHTTRNVSILDTNTRGAIHGKKIAGFACAWGSPRTLDLSLLSLSLSLSDFTVAPTSECRTPVKRFASLQFLNPGTVGRTLWTGDWPVAKAATYTEQHKHKHRINADRSVPWVRFEPAILVPERRKTAPSLWWAFIAIVTQNSLKTINLTFKNFHQKQHQFDWVAVYRRGNKNAMKYVTPFYGNVYLENRMSQDIFYAVFSTIFLNKESHC